MPEWNSDFGDPERTEMAAVLQILAAGSVETAEQQLASRYPWIGTNQIGIVVRKARQLDRAGRADELAATVHEFVHRAMQTKPPLQQPPPRRTGWARLWRWGR